MVLMSDGIVMTWGHNTYGEVGDGAPLDRYGLPELAVAPEPRPVVGLPRAARAVAGLTHRLAALDDGSVWAWGNNQLGQLGIDAPPGGRHTTPKPVLGLTAPIVEVAVGSDCSFAVTDDGAVLGWGSYRYGQLGDGTTTDRPRPTRVPRIGGQQVPSWRPSAKPVPDDDLPVGATKIGGRPDLPAGSAWPSCGGLPLSFVAQINLADATAIVPEIPVPTHGVLSFFYDTDRRPSGMEPSDAGGWQLDSDSPDQRGWSDDGTIYFWIRDEDLAARRFDKTWVILQST